MTFSNLKRYLPPILWMIFMFYMSSKSDLPSNQVYAVDFITKKIAHISEYFVLTLLWARALKRPLPDLALIFALIYAFSDETHQLFIPNRSGALRDVGIDFLGITAATLLVINYNKWKKHLSRPRTKTRKA